MAEVLIRFDAAIADAEGREHTARVCGRENENGHWEGWIEFEPRGGGPVLRTGRETTQPNRKDTEYWASGLTDTYLEGALQRARRPEVPDLAPPTVDDQPAYDQPAPPSPEAQSSERSAAVRQRTVLDPFQVYLQGEDTLREELRALDDGHLRNIIRAHRLVGEEEVDLQAMERPALADLIVAAVRRRSS